MFAGHIGAALAIGRFERRVNVGAFVIAALLLDLLLWIFVLLGLESVTISADFAATHHLEFIFPYSHGFLMSIAWSVLAAAAAVPWYPPLKEARFRAAMLIAAAVFSHWVLDALVHVPELPLAGEGSLKVGLGLWRAMAVALVVESLFVAIGLFLFLQGSSLLPARKIWLALLAILVLSFTVVGMTTAPPPPSARALAASSLVTITVVCALFGWLSKLPNER